MLAMRFAPSRNLGLFLLLVTMAGCGNSEPAADQKPAKAAPVGIFVSTKECVEAGKISEEMCGQAVDMAIRIHQVQTPTFTTPGQCAASYGEGNCTRAVDGSYAPRLQAYLITMSTPPSSEPLYAAKDNTIGFKAPKKGVVNALDDTLIVSASAMAIAHDNARAQ